MYWTGRVGVRLVRKELGESKVRVVRDRSILGDSV